MFEEFSDITAINLGFADKDDLFDHTITMADFHDNAVFLSLRNEDFIVWTAKEPAVGMIFQNRPAAIAYAKELIAQVKEAAKQPADDRTGFDVSFSSKNHKANSFEPPRQAR
ncbi:MAG: hypothetical protein P4N41_07355 [Negativicutes bacterium]|nr:hypothetical protein [Negativicutes bacterium]